MPRVGILPAVVLAEFILFFVGCGLAKIDSLVEVYDNVLSDKSASWLHSIVKDRPNSDEVFIFPLEEPAKHSPLEQFLNQLMHELYPNTDIDSRRYYVEFWKRTPWAHIAAHADMDRSSEDIVSGELKHPETGHVLYLDIGESVQGPTLVWNVTKGGDFYKQPISKMVVVPAVVGRLTRFQGRTMHAVPRPADLYWSHREDRRDGPEFQRSVLLFNTWPVEGGDLLGYKTLNAATTVGNATTDEEDDRENNDDKEKEKEEEAVISSSDADKNQKEEDNNLVVQFCNSKLDWVSVDLNEYEPPPPISLWSWMLSFILEPPIRKFQIPLMGNEFRRGMKKYTALLQGPIELPNILEECNKVSSIMVHPPKKLLLEHQQRQQQQQKQLSSEL